MVRQVVVDPARSHRPRSGEGERRERDVRVPELKAIAEWLVGWAETEFGWNPNLIALGDFNISGNNDDLYDAFTSTGLKPAPGLANLPRTIFDEPTKPHHYEQIAWFTPG